jgi:hypothetical protein
MGVEWRRSSGSTGKGFGGGGGAARELTMTATDGTPRLSEDKCSTQALPCWAAGITTSTPVAVFENDSLNRRSRFESESVRTDWKRNEGFLKYHGR